MVYRFFGDVDERDRRGENLLVQLGCKEMVKKEYNNPRKNVKNYNNMKTNKITCKNCRGGEIQYSYYLQQLNM